MKALRWTLVVSLVATYVLIVLGALVRSTNSGLSCPDWPTCYGQWVITPAQFAALGYTGFTYTQVMLEWVHRALAGVFVGPLVLGIVALAVVHRRRRPELVSWAVLLLVLLLVQAKLGGLTVFDANSPWSVALHLGNALLVFAVMAKLWVMAGPAPTTPIGEAPRLVAGAACLAALMTMVTAAMTAKSGASLACSTWPACNGVWLPDLDDPLVRVHFFHRALALLTGLLVLLLVIVGWRQGDARLRRALWALPAVVLVQALLGALVIWLQVPVWTAVLHQATGVALFLALSYVLWWLRAAPRPRPSVGDREDVGLRGPGTSLRAT
ncbi:MAG: COX15/CtaA family protein [Pseudomonadota bacterium]